MSSIRKFSKRLTILLLLSLLVLIYLGIQGEAIAAPTAQATLQDLSGHQLSGRVTFRDTEAGLMVEAEVSHAPPGYHGFHIHETGNCADGGNAAGGHFNLDNVKHGNVRRDGLANAHAGDLGNLEVELDGTGTYRQVLPGLTVADGPYAIANRAVILHAKIDSYAQPTGNAGGRIGCGVIRS